MEPEVKVDDLALVSEEIWGIFILNPDQITVATSQDFPVKI